MPPQAWSAKRERQYEHIKEGLEEHGRSEGLAEEIAARTVNKERARHGEAKEPSRTSTDDISSRRVAFTPWSGWSHARSAVRGGEAQGHQRSFKDEQGPARARRRPLIERYKSDRSGRAGATTTKEDVIVMALIVLVLLLALLFGGLGFVAHAFWLLAVIFLIAWVAGFAFRSGEGSRWYKY